MQQASALQILVLVKMKFF